MAAGARLVCDESLQSRLKFIPVELVEQSWRQTMRSRAFLFRIIPIIDSASAMTRLDRFDESGRKHKV